MTVLTSPYVIEERDPTTLEGAEAKALGRFHQLMQSERFPEDPLTPLELVMRRMRHRPESMEAKDWLVKAGDEFVAAGWMARWKNESNAHWRDAWIGVHPEHRRRGIASRLLRRIVDTVADDPDVIFGSNSNDRVFAGGAFHRTLGASEGLDNRTSELRTAEIDRAMVAEWSKIDPAGYRLVWVDGNVPDDLIPNVIVAYDTMNTAPRGDLQFGDWHTTAEEIRDWDRIRTANGGVRRLLLAIHEPTGETAGFTEVNRHPMTPWVVGQQGTAVVPAHRSHGIGKWIKARMLERVLREWSDARFIRTGNAYSNAPMLSINDRLGFRVVLSVMVWQTKLADARTYLEARGL
jgi:GNAT superfamily N-acetyltransferase